MPQLSIIIPVYNGKQYLQNCVTNLTAQELSEIEIIIVDDGSTDGSLEMLRSFESEKIRVFSQSNAGAGAARNTGLAQATGEYVAFLDVDDQYANTATLKTLYEKAKQSNAVICGGSFGYDRDCTPDEKRLFSAEGYVGFEEYQFIHGFQRFVFKRDFLMDNNTFFPPYRVYEDPVFLMNAMISAGGFYAIPDVVYIYSGSHQTELNAEKTVDYLRGLRDCLERSSVCGYAELHKDLFNRLNSSASYYAERNLVDAAPSLLCALMNANQAIDKKLLRKANVILEDDYVIPALETIWRASKRYMKLRKGLASLKFWTRGR